MKLLVGSQIYPRTYDFYRFGGKFIVKELRLHPETNETGLFVCIVFSDDDYMVVFDANYSKLSDLFSLYPNEQYQPTIEQVNYIKTHY